MTTTVSFVNAWNMLDYFADESTQERFELDDILYDISMTLIKYRQKRGITQKQLAAQLDISQSMVSKLESFEYNPTIELLWKVTKKLGITLRIELTVEDIFEDSISIPSSDTTPYEDDIWGLCA